MSKPIIKLTVRGRSIGRETVLSCVCGCRRVLTEATHPDRPEVVWLPYPPKPRRRVVMTPRQAFLAQHRECFSAWRPMGVDEIRRRSA